jgi:hypothetical protein
MFTLFSLIYAIVLLYPTPPRPFRSVLSEFGFDLVFRKSFSRPREKQAPVLYPVMLRHVYGIYKYKRRGFSGTQIKKGKKIKLSL